MNDDRGNGFHQSKNSWNGSWGGRKPNILIIEDEQGPREALNLILQTHYKTTTTKNGYEALQLLENKQTSPFDVITLDLKLPGTPGSQLIGDIKRISPDSEVIIISGTGTLDTAIEGIRNRVADFITKPFSVVGILSSVKRALCKRQKRLFSPVRTQDKKQPFDYHYDPEAFITAPFLFPQFTSNESNDSSSTPQTPKTPQPIDMLEFARVLVTTLDGQDRYTHGHSERVAHFSVMVADDLGFTEEELQELILAAYLHDIGKVGIDREIIRKEGSLSPSEKIILRSHPQRGVKIVEPLGLSLLTQNVIRYHHESWNGSGYPNGLKEEQIPLAARIVRVADAYDAMISHRPYRLPYPKPRAIEELKNGKGKEFDPRVVDVFLKKLRDLN